MTTTIQQLKDFEGQEVTLNGWVYNTPFHRKNMVFNSS